MLTIEPILAFKDNYIWSIRQRGQANCIIIDPGDATPVNNYLAINNLSLSAILITHHHPDHTGGLAKLVKKYQHIPIYGPDNNIPFINHYVNNLDIISFNIPKITLKVITIPGHTLDHIAYLDDTRIFCGDTLFAGGCGRIFEGTTKQMWQSLNKIKNLSPNLKIYCAHEYTVKNLQFAKIVDPNNQNLIARISNVNKLIINNKASLPSTLAEELATNPFLRCGTKEIRQAAIKFSKKELVDELAVFTVIRSWKDTF